MKTYFSNDVFGLTPNLPLNYVERIKVDAVFKRALKQKRHIVIHGGSKQGKTSLRKKHLDTSDAITIVCQNKWTLSELFVAILKQIGFRVEVSNKRATETRNKIAAVLEATLGFNSIAKLKGVAKTELENSGKSEVETKILELDPADANDIIGALKSVGFDKYISLEDFHYLPEDTQKDFSFALKAFFDNSTIRFIVVGVWKEGNRLASYNGDLRLRMTNIDADAWSNQELQNVIMLGESLLNIEFSASFKNMLIECCFESVAIVQEACARVCQERNIEETCTDKRSIRSSQTGQDLVLAIVMEGAGQFHDFVVDISAGFQATALQMYYWIMSAILECSNESLKKGLSLNEIFNYISNAHPFEIQMASVTQALKALRSLQAQKNVRPIIIDYDSVNKRLEVMDRSFLIWRNVLPESEMRSLIESANPTPKIL